MAITLYLALNGSKLKHLWKLSQ